MMNFQHSLRVAKIILIILSSFVLFTSCEEPTLYSNKDENTAGIKISVHDVNCTEAYLSINTEKVNLNGGAEVTLFRDDTAKFQFTLYSPDTLFIDSGLSPSRVYHYKAKLTYNPVQINGTAAVESNTVEVATLDTTSNEITWEKFILGSVEHYTRGIIYDVAIINENNIWAVGIIHTAQTDIYDSNRVWVYPYNAAHWDGIKWEYIRINGFHYPINCIHAFSNNDIWFDGFIELKNGEYILHSKNFPLDSNGNNWRRRAMWGVSNKNFYVVGDGGNIAHYKNGDWTKIESGTNVNLLSIDGTSDGSIKYVCGFSPPWGNTVLLTINNNEETKILYENSYRGGTIGDVNVEIFSDVFIHNNKTYLLDRKKLLEVTSVNPLKVKILEDNNSVKYAIDGSGVNDILIDGYKYISHYNGVNWRKYYITNDNEEFYFHSAALKGNALVLGGCLYELQSTYAVIVVGKKTVN